MISALPATESIHRFVVSHGKGGALGIFTAADPMPLRRGQAVVLHTLRGIEIGSVLCPATDRQALLLGATSAGHLLRRVTSEDRSQREEQATLEQQIFETSRAWAKQDGLALEILDVDLLFDASSAIVQFVGADTDTEAFAQKLEQHFSLTIRLENLATPAPPEEEAHGCDKPDCGRTADGGGGCTTCSTGGGCSSCGSSKVDLRQYFGHLRTKMNEKQRIPLA
ncbi:MAG: hypothetical protein EXR98_13055 [Gemmataceae bacterium]|nr:hypothetical protein [Gemmataceae bacterium]